MVFEVAAGGVSGVLLVGVLVTDMDSIVEPKIILIFYCPYRILKFLFVV